MTTKKRLKVLSKMIRVREERKRLTAPSEAAYVEIRAELEALRWAEMCAYFALKTAERIGDGRSLLFATTTGDTTTVTAQ